MSTDPDNLPRGGRQTITIPTYDPARITDQEAIEGVRREIRLRKSVYARRVPSGAMTPAAAAFQIAVMQRVEQIVVEATASGRLL